jgi:hypothetical protein
MDDGRGAGAGVRRPRAVELLPSILRGAVHRLVMLFA